ncbi:NUDIX domain-containing protein [Streptomyces paludis]|uniref:NUDIX domain-containing protein n=1 Tax=Streptomyces paludis TaxID=2282738 RepID=A0A345I085_9ACTN|nr:NUDIX domain-containing protein [Streptomyces paludis]
MVPGLLAEAAEAGIGQFVVGALISDEAGRVLLLRRKPDDFLGGLWELPGGGVEPGEGVGEALSREVAEETGLALAEVTGYAGAFDYASGSGLMTRQFTFSVTVEEHGPVELTEHDGAMWADRGELPNVSDETRVLLGR